MQQSGDFLGGSALWKKKKEQTLLKHSKTQGCTQKDGTFNARTRKKIAEKKIKNVKVKKQIFSESMMKNQHHHQNEHFYINEKKVSVHEFVCKLLADAYLST